jgi:hypothetical protein
VRATLDRIEVSGATGDHVVLKYHWMPKLRTDPPLPLEEAAQPGADVGFIAVRTSGTTDFVIRPCTLYESAKGSCLSERRDVRRDDERR